MYWPIDDMIKKGNYDVSQFFKTALEIVEKTGMDSEYFIYNIIEYTKEDVEVLNFLQEVKKIIGEVCWENMSGKLMSSAYYRNSLPVLHYIYSTKKDNMMKKMQETKYAIDCTMVKEIERLKNSPVEQMKTIDFVKMVDIINYLVYGPPEKCNHPVVENQDNKEMNNVPFEEILIQNENRKARIMEMIGQN